MYVYLFVGSRVSSKFQFLTAIFAIAALVALLVLECVGANQLIVLAIDWQKSAQALAVATLGICLSVWLTRMLNNETLTWENLPQYGTTAYSPMIRFLILVALTALLMILLGTGIVEVTIMTFDLNSFTDDPKNAIVIGLFAGLAEKRMTNIILNTFAE